MNDDGPDYGMQQELEEQQQLTEQEETMNKSDSIKELATALAKAQGEIKGAAKDSANPFFKSKYADLASVVEAIRAAFSKHGLSYIQQVSESEKNEVRVETVLLHASGEWIQCGVLALPVSKADAQGYGSALTYARRYSLSAAVGVAPEDDDGNAATKAAPTITPTAGAKENIISIERRALVEKTASAMMDWLNQGAVDDAVLTAENAGLDPEEKVYLWTFFDSKQRSSMKKSYSTMNAKSTQA